MPAPTQAQIIAARQAAGLTQTQAASLLQTTCRTWQRWERGDSTMRQAIFEAFLQKTTKLK